MGCKEARNKGKLPQGSGIILMKKKKGIDFRCFFKLKYWWLMYIVLIGSCLALSILIEQIKQKFKIKEVIYAKNN